MLDTYLFETDEHTALRRTVHRFASTHIAPHAERFDIAGEFPRELTRQAAEAGVLGIGYDTAHGGAGGDLGHLLVASDEMIAAGHSVGTTVGLGSHSIALPPVLRFGTPEQIDRFVGPVLRGEQVAALAVTEPQAGSDVAALRTRARREGDFYVVHGNKAFITSGCRADWITCAVRTDDDPHGGLSLLVIERDTPGFVVSRAMDKMGWCASDTAELAFENCRVPVTQRIGDEGGGFAALMQNFAAERLALAAQAVAIARLALREAATYAAHREAFGRPLAGFQVTRHKLADMGTRVAAARAHVGDAIQRTLAGEGNPSCAAMAKNASVDALSWVVDQAVQIHGGAGYLRGTPVERLYRDARLYAIGGGTREIMNEIIGKFAALDG